MTTDPLPVEQCANCGQPRLEHSYNGACYGVCGEFVATRPQHDREAIADIEAIRALLITATRTVYKTADIRGKSNARATIMAKLPALLDELERLRSA